MITTSARYPHLCNNRRRHSEHLSEPDLEATRKQSADRPDSRVLLVGVPIEYVRMLQTFLGDFQPCFTLECRGWHESARDLPGEFFRSGIQQIVLGDFAQDRPDHDTLLSCNREIVKRGRLCLIWSNSPSALAGQNCCRVEYGIGRATADNIARWLRRGAVE